jgi:hypothetical protein
MLRPKLGFVTAGERGKYGGRGSDQLSLEADVVPGEERVASAYEERKKRRVGQEEPLQAGHQRKTEA